MRDIHVDRVSSPPNIRNGFDDGMPKTHPLLSHGSCLWPGCSQRFGSAGFVQDFRDHLDHEHALDERSTAQLRVQVTSHALFTYLI